VRCERLHELVAATVIVDEQQVRHALRSSITFSFVPDPTDPHRKKKRAKRKEPDFIIDPSKPNATIELETADLLQLGQSGLVEARINKTRELALSDLEELREGMPIEDPKVMVDLGPEPEPPEPREQNVFVDFGPEPVRSARSSAQMPAQRSARASSPMAIPQQQPIVAASVIVEPQHRPPTPIPVAALVPPPVNLATPVNVQRVTPTMPKVDVATARSPTAEIRVPRRSSGAGLVVLVYLISAAALAASIYFRWFA
jgi:hypothetical protein